MSHFHRFFSLALFLLPTISLAETGPLGFGTKDFTQDMQTDRPDFTEGTQSVQTGHLQVEAGYTYTYDDQDGTELNSHVLPELLLRAGLATDWELRLTWAGYISDDIDVDGGTSTTLDGASDMGVGVKHRFYADEQMNLGFIAELGIPVGASQVTSDELEPGVKFLWDYALEKFDLGGNINLASIEGGTERILEASAALALGIGLTQELGSYVEYFGFYPEGGVPEEDRHFLNGGFTYAWNSNVQLDLRAGLGLNDEAEDFFSGAGVSFRL